MIDLSLFNHIYNQKYYFLKYDQFSLQILKLLKILQKTK